MVEIRNGTIEDFFNSAAKKGSKGGQVKGDRLEWHLLKQKDDRLKE